MISQVQDFYLYIASERALSKNTQEAYRRDLEKFVAYLIAVEINSFEKVTQSHLLHFLEGLQKKGYASSTLSRLMMTLKVFFPFFKARRAYQGEHDALHKEPKDLAARS